MTSLVRAVFLHNTRLADLVLTLKFDHNLNPLPEKTIVFYGPHDFKTDYNGILRTHDIDINQFEFIPDRKLLNDQPGGRTDVDIYQYGGWIGQQFIKLIALDHLCRSFDLVLIQDCDTFNLKPYDWIGADSVLQMYGLPQTSHSKDYYRFVEIFTGQPRLTDYCFVTEFMPIRKKSWQLLKSQLEKHGQNWLHRIDTVFQNQKKSEQIWFSEYELLGNWNLFADESVRIIPQQRFELARKNWQAHLGNLKDCHVVANYGSIALDDVDHWANNFKVYS